MAKAKVQEILFENIKAESGDIDAKLDRAVLEFSKNYPELIFVYDVNARGRVTMRGFAGWSAVPVDTVATRGTLMDQGGFIRNGEIVALSRGYQNKLDAAKARSYRG